MLRVQLLSGEEIRLRVERLLGGPQPSSICMYCLQAIGPGEQAFFMQYNPARRGPLEYAEQMLGFPDVEVAHEACAHRVNPYERTYW